MNSDAQPNWQEWEGSNCHRSVVAWSHGHVNLDDDGHREDALRMVRRMGVDAREVWLIHGMVLYDEADTPQCASDVLTWYEIFPATFVALEDV